jgi:NAD(P)-dependent dehydrogenase (short-subunit alcohol dehydrogenase family)
MSKTWFITGASRGIGAAIARAALAAGNRVVATGRQPDTARSALADAPGAQDGNLLVVALDITDAQQIHAAVGAALERFGRIDVLVNNAGYGQLGVFEQTTDADVRAQYETNVFGMMAVTRAVAPLMREQRDGRIITISSVAGLKGVFGGSIYNSSKFAVEGFVQAIAEELAHFNVHVTAVAPGFFRTDFLDPSSAKYTDNAISDYDKPLAEFLDFHRDRSHNQAGDPAKLGEVVVHLTEIDNPPVSFVAGSDAVQWALTAVEERREQVQRWHDLSVSTDGTWSQQADATS